MKYDTQTLPFGSLFMGVNVRIPANLNIPPLSEDIEERNLKNPLMVWQPNGNDRYEIIQGHRRFMALETIQTRNAKRFEELFGQGVPCLVVSDVTPEEVFDLKVDHGTEESLRDPFEIQLCANLLFKIGKTEKQVIIQLSSLVDRVIPMKAETKKGIEKLREDKAKYEAEGDNRKAAAVQKEVDDAIFDYRRGYVQGLHTVARCPDCVMAAEYLKATGEKPEGYENEDLPRLTKKSISSLWDAHKEDMSELENGKPRWSKSRPGPLFRAKWKQLVESSKKDPKKKKAKPKSLPASEILTEVTEGRVQSALGVALCNLHAGNKAYAERVPELDTASHYTDLVREHDKKLWEKVVKSAKDIEAIQREEDEAAEGKAEVTNEETE
jgi:hypothetical protein